VHENKKIILIAGLTVVSTVAGVLSWLPILLETLPNGIAWLYTFQCAGWLISLALAIYALTISRKWHPRVVFGKAIVTVILFMCIIASLAWGSILLLSYILSRIR
jgi:hypothetical protein